jgi:hypothetical protein
MAGWGPLQSLDEEDSVASLRHVSEGTEVLSSEWHWILDFSEAVRGGRLADMPQHSHVEPIVPLPALTILPQESVGIRFFCNCPRPFPTKAGHKSLDSELTLLSRWPDL